MIATSTPELKRLIEDEEMINIRKNRAKGKRKLSIGVTQTLLSSSSSDSECDMVGLLDDSSDDLLHHSDEDLTRCRGYQNRIVQEALPEQRKQYNLALI